LAISLQDKEALGAAATALGPLGRIGGKRGALCWNGSCGWSMNPEVLSEVRTALEKL